MRLTRLQHTSSLAKILLGSLLGFMQVKDMTHVRVSLLSGTQHCAGGSRQPSEYAAFCGRGRGRGKLVSWQHCAGSQHLM